MLRIGRIVFYLLAFNITQEVYSVVQRYIIQSVSNEGGISDFEAYEYQKA